MRQKEKNISSEPVRFEKHAPERRGRIGAYLFCNGGCCCCCCCLHSLGGLVGAATAMPKSKSPLEGSVVGCYWICVALLAGVFVVFTWASAEWFGIIGALLFLPLLQLLAGMLTWIWIQIRRADLPAKEASLEILGRITLYFFLGALAGGIAMIAGFKMFS